jgi:hypothetical protein
MRAQGDKWFIHQNSYIYLMEEQEFKLRCSDSKFSIHFTTLTFGCDEFYWQISISYKNN